jgi:hypothetical protein
MAQLHIALQEGFEDTTVVIRVAGREAFNKDHVNTKLQIGLADSFDVAVESGSVSIEVELPSRSLSKSIELQVPEAIYLGVSVISGRIEYKVSAQPFGYV